jgi:hypothetical protein
MDRQFVTGITFDQWRAARFLILGRSPWLEATPQLRAVPPPVDGLRGHNSRVLTEFPGVSAVPFVLDFHGLGGSGMQQQSSSGFQAVADREGFLIAFPDGIDNAWNIGPCCTNSRDVDDVGFAKAMIAAISAAGCVDPQRVYATGFSMGGGMSQYLACHAADVVPWRSGELRALGGDRRLHGSHDDRRRLHVLRAVWQRRADRAVREAGRQPRARRRERRLGVLEAVHVAVARV